jgi:hypothetical protein
MGEVVNLRQHRKRKSREDAHAAAAENRQRFGQKKGDRERLEAETRRSDAELGSKKLTD